MFDVHFFSNPFILNYITKVSTSIKPAVFLAGGLADTRNLDIISEYISYNRTNCYLNKLHNQVRMFRDTRAAA
jgi:hypothetical protein